MKALEQYLREVRDIHRSGAGMPETSYYGSLEMLLNEAGKGLKPRVHCVPQLANTGAGSPDIGLFTPDQFQRVSEKRLIPGVQPSRGVVEVKSPADDAWLKADGEQVSRYWGHYGQVFVTNLRDFVLVGRDSEGKPAKLETYQLAATDDEFWAMAATPVATAAKHGRRFEEFLLRVLQNSAPLTSPKDLAWHLASYAREALYRVEEGQLQALTSLRTALEQALGLEFRDERGEHFFRSTLVQTLFYGVFSAWVLWCKEQPKGGAAFRWRDTAWHLRVPMIRVLYEQVSAPTRLGPLRLVEVLDWAEAALNRVDRALFFARFEEEYAVQYFYEPFLQAFDPELRKQLGVWYTPPEIVEYMVERVDTVLRTELDIADGLADPRVYVLDPCAGTGSYLVEGAQAHREDAEGAA